MLNAEPGRGPIPPDTPRSDVLGRLQRDRWLAADAGETRRVAEIDAVVRRLSASGSPVPSARETTGRLPKTTVRGARRVPGRSAA